VNFPKEGIIFRDITSLLQNAQAFKMTIDLFLARYIDRKIDVVIGLESRGFLFGAPIALGLNVGIVLIRKKGKLPFETVSVGYNLEYGIDIFEMHVDAIKPGQQVLIIDDLIATGGTMAAAVALVHKVGALVVECACVVELPDLNGRDKLKGENVFALIDYEGH